MAREKITATSYTANVNGDEIVDCRVTLNDVLESARDIEEARERIKYWNSLERVTQDYYLSKPGSLGDSKKDHLIGAIGEAFTQSPGEVQKRNDEDKAYKEELLKCSRSGKMVQRQNGITVCDTFTSFIALNDAEAEVFGIDKSKYIEC